MATVRGEGFWVIEWNAKIDPETKMPVKELHREFKKFHPSYDDRPYDHKILLDDYVPDDRDLSRPDITTTLVDDEVAEEAFGQAVEFVNNLSSDDSDDDY